MDCTPRIRLVPTVARALALTLALAGMACQQLPRQVGKEVQVLEVGALAERNPADVAVLPIEIAARGVGVDGVRMRRAFQRGLVKRRYSPLAIDFIDSRTVNASYVYGTLGEEAVCQIVVHGWDDTLWETHRVIDLDVALRMVDPARPDGPSLWAGRLAARIDVNRHANVMGEMALRDEVLEELASELLAAMPARRTEAGAE